jgi:hypothetical protein
MDGNGALAPPKSVSSVHDVFLSLLVGVSTPTPALCYVVNLFRNVESDRMQRTPSQIAQLLESFFCVFAPTFWDQFCYSSHEIHQQTVHERKITMASYQPRPTPSASDVPTPNGTAAIGSNLKMLISDVFTLCIKIQGFRRHMRMPNFRDFRLLDKSNGSEKLLQEHVIAISLGLYIETALGPLFGSLVVYLHGHWMT